MGSNHPVLADDALNCVELIFLVLVRGVGGDVDVAPVVVEDGSFGRGLEVVARAVV